MIVFVFYILFSRERLILCGSGARRHTIIANKEIIIQGVSGKNDRLNFIYIELTTNTWMEDAPNVVELRVNNKHKTQIFVYLSTFQIHFSYPVKLN